MKIATAGVVGSGTMGAGIAQRCAMYHYPVVLVDSQPGQLESARAAMERSLGKFVEKGRLTPESKRAVLERIEFCLELERVAECDLVVEAVPENAELKKQVFRKLDGLCRQDTILASNTSSIPLTPLAEATRRPERVLGIHFMNPVPLMKLVEMIPARQTAEEVFRVCEKFVVSLDCEVVRSRDAPGFIVNRVLMPMINEAVEAYAAGVASVKDIDRAMMLGTNQPMGPLALADVIGLDVVLSILQTLHAGLDGDRYRPSPLLEDYVRQNRLGRKTGKGFYDYR
ncbi:MAG: 3-hydroxyacyl-CoA dehydrogenase family protein [Nitrospinales bacterium]